MKPIFKISHETQTLVDYFMQIQIGSPVSFDVASNDVNFSVSSSLPSYNTARRIVQRDHSVVIEAIKGFGFIRVSGGEIVKSADRFFRRVRRGARREAHKQEIAVMSNLERDDMIKATENLSRLRIIETTSISLHQAISNRPVVVAPPLV